MRCALLTLLLVLALAPRAARADDPTRPLREQGCTACHSLDGAPGQGPSFAGLAGRERRVVRGGEVLTVVADPAYLRRAILEPDAEVVEGHRAGFMPRYPLDDAAVDGLVAAIAAVPDGSAPGARGWGLLGLGLLLFVGGHLALSSAPLRRPLVERLGEGGFAGLYSLVAVVGMGLLAGGYAEAPYVPLYDPPRWTRWVPNAVMPVAILLLVLGYTTRSPAMARADGDDDGAPRGIHRITRHPALWGSALWALAHVPPNGDLRSTLLFGGMAVLSLVGMVHIDHRRAARRDDLRWARFAGQTSLVPFAAILAGRQRLAWRELGAGRVALALACWAALLAGHRWLVGVSPHP